MKVSSLLNRSRTLIPAVFTRARERQWLLHHCYPFTPGWSGAVSLGVLPKDTPRYRWPDSNAQPLDHESNALMSALSRLTLRYRGGSIEIFLAEKI